MPQINLNLSGVSDLEAIPAGVYPARIFEVKSSTSKKDNPVLNVVFIITEGEYAETRIFHNLTIIEQSMPFVKRFLRAFFTKEELNVPTFELDTEALVGRDCRIRLIQEKYEGEWQNKVRSVVRPDAETDDFEELGGDDDELPFDIEED